MLRCSCIDCQPCLSTSSLLYTKGVIVKCYVSLPPSKIKHSHPRLQLPHTSHKVNNTKESAGGAVLIMHFSVSSLFRMKEKDSHTEDFHLTSGVSRKKKNNSHKTQKGKCCYLLFLIMADKVWKPGVRFTSRYRYHLHSQSRKSGRCTQSSQLNGQDILQHVWDFSIQGHKCSFLMSQDSAINTQLKLQGGQVTSSTLYWLTEARTGSTVSLSCDMPSNW